MAYHVVFVVPGKPEGVEGEIIASGLGWDSWCSWVEEHDPELPHAAHLCAEGWLDPAAALDGLAEELAGASDAPEDVAGVSDAILSALSERPEGCDGIIVTDGTPGE